MKNVLKCTGRKDESHARGVSLLEFFLTVAVMGVVLIFALQMVQNRADETLIQSSAAYMDVVGDGIDHMTSTINRFSAVFTATVAPLDLFVAEPVPAVAGAISLENGGMGFEGYPAITAQFSDSMPLKVGLVGTRWRSGGGAVEPRLDFLFMTARPLPETLVRKIAGRIRKGGGYISAVPDTLCALPDCLTTIRGAFGEWSLDLAFVPGIAGTPLFTTLLNTPPVSGAGGSMAYLVIYRTYSGRTVAGDYLYRDINPVDLNLGLNAMSTALDMGGFRMIGIDIAEIAGDLTVTIPGGTIISNELEIGGNLTSNNMDVEGDLDLTGNLIVDSTTTITGNLDTGTLTLQQNAVLVGNPGALDLGTLTVVGASEVTGTLETQTFQTQNVDTDILQGSGTLTTGNFTAASVTTGAFNSARDLQVTDVQADSATLSTTDLFAGTLSVGIIGIGNLTGCGSGCQEWQGMYVHVGDVRGDLLWGAGGYSRRCGPRATPCSVSGIGSFVASGQSCSSPDPNDTNWQSHYAYCLDEYYCTSYSGKTSGPANRECGQDCVPTEYECCDSDGNCSLSATDTGGCSVTQQNCTDLYCMDCDIQVCECQRI